MSDDTHFVENLKGVHLMYGEFTLCGDAFDAPDSEADWEDGPFSKTRKRVVTCPDCVRLIEYCRGVRVSHG